MLLLRPHTWDSPGQGEACSSGLGRGQVRRVRLVQEEEVPGGPTASGAQVPGDPSRWAPQEASTSYIPLSAPKGGGRGGVVTSPSEPGPSST